MGELGAWAMIMQKTLEVVGTWSPESEDPLYLGRQNLEPVRSHECRSQIPVLSYTDSRILAASGPECLMLLEAMVLSHQPCYPELSKHLAFT